MGFIRIYSADEWDALEKEKESKKSKSETPVQQKKEKQQTNFFDESIPTKQEENKELLDLIDNKKRLLERFQLYGVHERRKISGDGNCQFAAVADQLFSNPKLHPKIRELVADWLRLNKNYKIDGTSISEFLETDCFSTWDEYCDYVATEGNWGDHFTLIAISELFECTITIISSVLLNSKNGDPITVIKPHLCKPKRVILLSHLHERHYGSLTIK